MLASRSFAFFLALQVMVAAGCWRDFDEPFGADSGGSDSSGGAPSGGGPPNGGSPGDGGAGAQGAGGPGGQGAGGSIAMCADDVFCAPSAPEGWTGPVLLFEGTASSTPECPGAVVVPSASSGTVSAPAAICNACVCTSPTGVTCNPVFIEFFDTCSSPTVINTETLGVLNQCEFTNVAGLTDGDAGIHVQTSIGNPGSCTATGGGVANLPAVTFENAARVCAADAPETCGSGGTCVDPPAGFLDAVCIAQQGAVECPAGAYDVMHRIYTDYEEQRGCSTCSCETPTGGVCNATLRGYSETGCNDNSSSVLSGACRSVSHDVASVALINNVVVNQGDCPEAGGESMGTVEPTGAWTICCTL